jgi:hypothetical protein
MENIRKNTWLVLIVALGFVLLAVVLWRAGGARATPDQYGGTPPTQFAGYPSPAGMASSPAPAASHTAVSSSEPEDGGSDGGGDG